jgi:hypothetical protein
MRLAFPFSGMSRTDAISFGMRCKTSWKKVQDKKEDNNHKAKLN